MPAQLLPMRVILRGDLVRGTPVTRLPSWRVIMHRLHRWIHVMHDFRHQIGDLPTGLTENLRKTVNVTFVEIIVEIELKGRLRHGMWTACVEAAVGPELLRKTRVRRAVSVSHTRFLIIR